MSGPRVDFDRLGSSLAVRPLPAHVRETEQDTATRVIAHIAAHHPKDPAQALLDLSTVLAALGLGPDLTHQHG